ncbi:hypothetical protein WJX73_002581 [Symbiochloris irregularis]|uniref:Btz domain-containing protein n=1 Tax=Symbiochloris irregularis TaxID=706552 RepID=A0AAW1P0E3_9CHLO
MASRRRDYASDDEDRSSQEEGEVEFSDSSDGESEDDRQAPARSSDRSTQSKERALLRDDSGAGAQHTGKDWASGESAADSASVEEGEVHQEVDRHHQEPAGNSHAEASRGAESRAFQPKKELQPFEVPTKGHFWLHDDRFDAGDPGRPTVSRRQKKLWDPTDDEKWQHDKFESLSRPPEEDDYMGFLAKGRDRRGGDRQGGRYGDDNQYGGQQPPGFDRNRGDNPNTMPVGRRAGNRQHDNFGGVAPDVDAVTELMAAAGFGEPNGSAGGNANDWDAEWPAAGAQPGTGEYLVAKGNARKQQPRHQQQQQASAQTRLSVSAKDYQPTSSSEQTNGYSSRATASATPNPGAVPFVPLGGQGASRGAESSGPLVVEGFPVVQSSGKFLQGQPVAPPYYQQQSFIPGPMQQSLAAPAAPLPNTAEC